MIDRKKKQKQKKWREVKRDRNFRVSCRDEKRETGKIEKGVEKNGERERSGRNRKAEEEGGGTALTDCLQGGVLVELFSGRLLLVGVGDLTQIGVRMRMSHLLQQRRGGHCVVHLGGVWKERDRGRWSRTVQDLWPPHTTVTSIKTRTPDPLGTQEEEQ